MKFKNDVDGILIVDKPKGITSRDVVNQIQEKFDTKAGHTGTLDPIATGVLVITLGKATKLSEILTAQTKEYLASAVFGIDTDTLDITGEKISEEDAVISKEKIEKALDHFKGSYDQEVPWYSAVKINGKKLYEYARSGKKVVLPKRKVEIFDISLVDYKVKDKKTFITFKVVVSKGTYIRSLIRDIGHYLNTCGVMSGLVRTKQGKFDIKSALKVDDVTLKDVCKIKDVLDMKQIKVDDEVKFKIINGQKLNYDYDEVLFLDKNGNELAIYKKEGNDFKIYKMLYKK